jgi:hypothetical protein
MIASGVRSCVRRGSHSKGKGFPDFGTSEPAIDHLVEKSKKIGEIDPKPTIQTSGVEASIHQRVVPLDHHEPFALQTIHGRDRPTKSSSFDSIHDQRQTSGQQPTPEYRGPEGEVGTGSEARMRPLKQIPHTALYHQDGESQEYADAEPPREGSHRCPRTGQPTSSKAAPDGHSSGGVPGCQADCSFARVADSRAGRLLFGLL